MPSVICPVTCEVWKKKIDALQVEHGKIGFRVRCGKQVCYAFWRGVESYDAGFD